MFTHAYSCESSSSLSLRLALSCFCTCICIFKIDLRRESSACHQLANCTLFCLPVRRTTTSESCTGCGTINEYSRSRVLCGGKPNSPRAILSRARVPGCHPRDDRVGGRHTGGARYIRHVGNLVQRLAASVLSPHRRGGWWRTIQGAR